MIALGYREEGGAPPLRFLSNRLGLLRGEAGFPAKRALLEAVLDRPEAVGGVVMMNAIMSDALSQGRDSTWFSDVAGAVREIAGGQHSVSHRLRDFVGERAHRFRSGGG